MYLLFAFTMEVEKRRNQMVLQWMKKEFRNQHLQEIRSQSRQLQEFQMVLWKRQRKEQSL